MLNKFFQNMLIIISILVVPITIHISISDAFATNDDNQWHKVYQLGKFHDPQKKDQIFISGYKIINGTVTELAPGAGAFFAHIHSNTNATLYYQVPRNFPYENSEKSYGIKSPIVMMDVPPLGSPQKDFVNSKEIFPVNKTSDCFFTYSISFFGDHTVQFAFSDAGGQPSYGDNITQSCNSQTIVNYIPPLQQINAGVDPKNVTCTMGLIAVLHPVTNVPACVKSDTSNILIERGWAKASN